MFEKIRERLVLSLLPERVKREALSPYDLMSFYQSGQPVYGDLTIRKATREGYKMSVYVYRSVRTIVQAISGIPWVAEKDGEAIPNHPFTQAWANPNPEFSGQDNMEFLTSHLLLVGNSLIQPVMVGGKPREFWMCMPDLIKPIPSDVKGEWLQGYEVTTAGGKKLIVPPDQFLHFQQFDPGNPYWGIGALQAAARTVDTDNEAQDTQKIQLQNRNIPPGVFQFDQNLTDPQFEEATQRVKEKFLQKSKRGEPWIMGGGYKWQQMSLTPQEMDYIASRLQNLRAIAGAFGLDPWWLGDRENSTYNNVAEARRSLFEDTGIPMLDDIRSTLNLKLSPMYPDKPYINYDLSNVAALRDDEEKKSQIATRYFAMGVPVSQINDRLELGLEEFSGWDTSYLPFSLAPSGSTALSGETEDVKTKALNLDTEEKKTMQWKRVDRRLVAWWDVIAKRILPLYVSEGKAVASAISGGKSVKVSADELTASAKRAIDAQRAKWIELLLASSLVVIDDFGKMVSADVGGTVFDPMSAAIRKWTKEHAAENVKTILKTNLDDVRRVILQGVDDGLTRPQLASKLRVFYDDKSTYKAMRIARTESAQAAGYGRHEAAKQSGVVKGKTWLSSRDDRVRDDHIAMDGESRGLNEAYSNGEMYAGESSINCRCQDIDVLK